MRALLVALLPARLPAASVPHQLVSLIYPFKRAILPKVHTFVPIFSKGDDSVAIELSVEHLGKMIIRETYDGSVGDLTVERVS